MLHFYNDSSIFTRLVTSQSNYTTRVQSNKPERMCITANKLMQTSRPSKRDESCVLCFHSSMLIFTALQSIPSPAMTSTYRLFHTPWSFPVSSLTSSIARRNRNVVAESQIADLIFSWIFTYRWSYVFVRSSLQRIFEHTWVERVD